MNKREFLKSLEKKLSILDEQEIKDIINEYEDIIDEKVKDGKTEEEAVKEFGSIDELATEILKTYKLNAKYTKENEPLKDTVENIEDGIKKASRSLADFFKNINNGNGISVELVFELIIKFLILLVILAILRLPFELLINIGSGIFEIAYYPINRVLNGFWHIGMIFLYFITAALIFVALFKQYVSGEVIKNKTVSDKKTVNETKKQAKKTETVIKEETVNIEKPVKDSNKESVFASIINGMYKIFMLFIFIIPLWCTNFGLVMALAIVTYFTIVGINIWGLIVLFLGLIVGFSWLTSFFHSITFKTKRITAILLPISILLTVIGGLAFASNTLTFDYIDKTNKLELSYETYEEEYNIPAGKEILVRYLGDCEIEYVTDNNLENSKLLIEITYPEEFMTIDNIELANSTVNDSLYRIYLTRYDVKEFSVFKRMYNVVIKDLKKGKIYNYSEDSYLAIKVKANEETMKFIK